MAVEHDLQASQVGVQRSLAATLRSSLMSSTPVTGPHVIRPLPFDPRSLRGLSERLLISHWENNYGGAVRNLNTARTALAKLPKDAPVFTVGALRERELTFHNSTVLHELYFGNLGDVGAPRGEITDAIMTAFGSLQLWEEHFRQMGLSLAGGSGWVVLVYCTHTRALRLHWSGNHTQSMAGSLPLLVMDMYEHSYHLDYGAAAASYIDAFFQNIQWGEVNRRYQAATNFTMEMIFP